MRLYKYLQFNRMYYRSETKNHKFYNFICGNMQINFQKAWKHFHKFYKMF